MPSVTSRTSAFPDSRRVIPSDHIVNVFGAQSRGLRTRYTWLHTHPLGYACRFTTVLAANLLWLGIGQFPAITHWVALSNFTKLLSDPKDLNLTRHEDIPFRITRSKTRLTRYFFADILLDHLLLVNATANKLTVSAREIIHIDVLPVRGWCLLGDQISKRLQRPA